MEFGPNDYKVVLKPRFGYVPKVLSTPFRAQVIPALPLQGPEVYCDEWGGAESRGNGARPVE